MSFAKLVTASLLFVLSACHHAPPKRDRSYASNDSKGFVGKPCFQAFDDVNNNPNINLTELTAACRQDIGTRCMDGQPKSSSPNHPANVNGMCLVVAEHGINKAVHQGSAAPACEQAAKVAGASNTNTDGDNALAICKAETEDHCSKQVSEGPKGWGNNLCLMIGTYHGFLTVNGGRCDVLTSCKASCDWSAAQRQSCVTACETDYDPNRTCTPKKNKKRR